MVAQIGVTLGQLLPQIARNLAVIDIVSLAQANWFREGLITKKILFCNKVQHDQ